MTPLRPFRYRGGELRASSLSLASLARRFGTPLYVYELDAIAAAVTAYQRAWRGQPHLVCAAVKANASLGVLERLARSGCGFDVVSAGELARVLRAGGRAQSIVFSGVGKTTDEMDAALRAGILLFQVESETELDLLAQRAARLRRIARFGLRVNPDVDARTHPAIATGLRQHKFGLALPLARRLYRRPPSRWLQPAGIGFHIGSQILAPTPFADATERVARLAVELEAVGISLPWFDVGGGLGIAYQAGQHPPSLAAYVRAIRAGWHRAGYDGRRHGLLLEPGRRLVAAAGALLSRVLYVKQQGSRHFVILDAGMNDLLRPSLYGAWHEIAPVRPRRGALRRVDVVGPVCESGDTFAQARRLPPLEPGDLVAVLDTGAYGFALASNYNARPRAAEVGISRGRAHLLRRRESVTDLYRLEALPG